MCSKCGGAAKHWRCFVPSRAQGRFTNDEVAKQIDHASLAVFLGLLVGANLGLAAGDTGTAEAKAMLGAVAAIETDEAAALAAFTAGDEALRTADLYVFCGDAADGSITAHGEFGPGRAEHARHQGQGRQADRRGSRSLRRASTTRSNMCAAPGRDRAFAENVVHHAKPATVWVWATISDGGFRTWREHR